MQNLGFSKTHNLAISLFLLAPLFSYAQPPNMACAFSKMTKIQIGTNSQPEVTAVANTVIITNGVEDTKSGLRQWSEVQRLGVSPDTQVFVNHTSMSVIKIILPLHERLAAISKSGTKARAKSGNSYQALLSMGMDFDSGFLTTISEGKCKIL